MSFVLLSKIEASYFNNIFAAFWFKMAFCEKGGFTFLSDTRALDNN